MVYRVRRLPGDTKPARSFVIVSRQALVGLKHDCAIHCDGLMSIEKSRLTDYVGELSETKKEQMDRALQIALALPTTHP